MLRASDLFSGVDESWPNNPRQILKKPLKSLIYPQNIGTFILHCLYTSDRIKIEKKTEKKEQSISDKGDLSTTFWRLCFYDAHSDFSGEFYLTLVKAVSSFSLYNKAAKIT